MPLLTLEETAATLLPVGPRLVEARWRIKAPSGWSRKRRLRWMRRRKKRYTRISAGLLRRIEGELSKRMIHLIASQLYFEQSTSQIP